MSERLPVVPPPPSTIPLCGPADTLELIAGGSRATAREPDRREWVFAAIHRSHGTWTHLYLVVELSRRGPSGNPPVPDVGRRAARRGPPPRRGRMVAPRRLRSCRRRGRYRFLQSRRLSAVLPRRYQDRRRQLRRLAHSEADQAGALFLEVSSST